MPTLKKMHFYELLAKSINDQLASALRLSTNLLRLSPPLSAPLSVFPLPCSASVELIDSLMDVEVSQPIPANTSSPVEIRLSDNAVVVLQNEGQIHLVCSLINALK